MVLEEVLVLVSSDLRYFDIEFAENMFPMFVTINLINLRNKDMLPIFCRSIISFNIIES